MLSCFKGGGELEPLFVAEIAVGLIPVVRDFRHREIMREPPLRPRYVDMEVVRERLVFLRTGMTVLELIRRDR